ncbi:inositol monophosphatase family protein [Amycolatopsis nigrescens]|uniref:inositol monophosphatase family protein n=1 Tax=Amycolatopsis nigrescens TaxID=381445 RepID=UPI00036099C3|nr:inositol monophosphatase family protein [Amycolatopsis nigrescens]
MTDDRPTDHGLARALAAAAGEGLVRLRDAPGAPTGAALGDAGDGSSHELLLAELARARPGDAVRSEHGSVAGNGRVWIVDPLDGTREFGEGRPDWAVHVALAEGERLIAGAIALPGRGVVLGTDDPPPVPVRGAGPIRIAVSRSRPPAFVDELATELGAQTVPLGSAGVKIAAVLLGEVDAYLHAGGQYEWDSAAPIAVAQAAGVFASRVDGSPLRYNQPDPWLPDLLVCHPDIADLLRRTLDRIGVEKSR